MVRWFKKVLSCWNWNTQNKLDRLLLNTEEIIKHMAEDTKDILDAIAGISDDVDVVIKEVDSLEAAVNAGGDSAAAFAAIRSALAPLKVKADAAAAHAAPAPAEPPSEVPVA